MAALALPFAALALGAGAIDKAAFGGKLGISDAIGGTVDELTGAAEGKRSEAMFNRKLESEAKIREMQLQQAREDRKAEKEDKLEQLRLEREYKLEDAKAQREADERKDAAAREERAFLMASASAKEARDAAITAAAQERQDRLKRDELNAKIVSESRAAALERFRATNQDFPKLRAVPELDEEMAAPIKKQSTLREIPQALFGEFSNELAAGGILGAGKMLFDKFNAIKGRGKGKKLHTRRNEDDEEDEDEEDEQDRRARLRRAKKIVQESQETTNALHPSGGYRNIPVAQHVTQSPGFEMKMPRIRSELNELVRG